MLLNQTEFTDIKDELVNDVLDKLKNFAEQEAELLFRELENQPNTYLPDYSMRISDAMNLVKDAVAKELENCSEEEFEQFYPILKAHLPDILAEKAFDRFKDNVPFAYAKNIISSSLATKIVYREGVSFIEEQGVEGIAKNAFKYVEEEKAIAKLKEQLMEGDLDSEAKDIIYQILDKGGIRTKLNMGSEN
jgi:glutamate dehydrogenase